VADPATPAAGIAAQANRSSGESPPCVSLLEEQDVAALKDPKQRQLLLRVANRYLARSAQPRRHG
jgi:hypothetical protein